jgi:PadR family transcriptional regulator
MGNAMSGPPSLDLLRGTLDLLILKTLSWGPMHGHAVASWVGRTTDEALLVEEGALYPALHRLERRGWIESQWGLSDNNRRAKYYQLTAEGRRRLRAEVVNWERYAQAVGRVLGADAPG